MSDNISENVGNGSPERVAKELYLECIGRANVETDTKEKILTLYKECLMAVKYPNS